MQRLSVSKVLVALALFVVLIHFVSAGDRPAAFDGSQEPKLVPGAKYHVTAKLECEIREVTPDSIHVSVSAIRRTMEGTPDVSKIPYVNRVFRNSGGQNTEMEVVIRIPMDQVEMIAPVQTVETSN